MYIRTEDGDEIKAGAESKIFFNPSQYTITKRVTWEPLHGHGLDVPIQHFKSGEARVLALSLVFDTYEDGSDVRDLVGQVAKLTEVGDYNQPPVCSFFWGDDQSNEAKLSFTGVIESMTQRYTLFRDDGTPVRATVDVSLKEAESPDRQHRRHPRARQSPLQPRTWVVKQGDTVWGIANAVYKDPSRWREIARANGLVDPRVLPTGALLRIPAID